MRFKIGSSHIRGLQWLRLDANPLTEIPPEVEALPQAIVTYDEPSAE